MLAADGGGGSGYQVVPDVLFRASVQMRDTKDFVYEIAGGAASDLQVSAGMAGDDTVAHSFAQKYEPAARTIVQGISDAGQSIGLTAGKLLRIAADYLAAEDKVAARFTGKIDTNSFAAAPEPDCEPQSVAAALPTVTGSAEVHEIPVIGKFWPQGNPDKLRATAEVWGRAAAVIDQAQQNAGQHAAPIPVYCSGQTITAFNAYVQRIYAADPTGSDVIDAGQPLMENLSAGCRQLQKICHQYADAIDDCRHTLIALGVAAGVITTAGVLLTIFTFGGSDAAAAGADAALAADAAVAADALVAAEADLAAASAVAEAEAVIEGALAKMAAAGMLTAAAVGVGVGTADSASAAPGVSLASYTGLPTIATVPPLPPGPPSGAFPPYGPQQLSAATAWYAGLDTRDPVYGTPDDIAYQVRTAGQPEVDLPTGDGDDVWADGYRTSDGAVIDAKHVRNQGCSPRTLNGITEQSRVTGFLIGKDDDEVSRYADAVNNPANHAQYLEVDVDDPETVGYWQYLAAQNGVPSDVRYVP